jgi:alpha-N-arabinofuranosidase
MIDLCNALDIEPIISLTRIQSPSDMADFVEYLHGDTTTAMGKKRAADGHPSKYEGYWFELGTVDSIPFGSYSIRSFIEFG